MKDVFIVSARRTPIGGLMGSLSHLTAPQLGAAAIKATCSDAGIDTSLVNEVYMGNVLSANVGQLPARQAAKFAGLPDYTEATTVNKVCASGMKATMIGAQQIELGMASMVIAGGMESMSNVPHYALLRKTHKYGNATFIDGLIQDGLTDVYNQFHMGSAAELCVKKYGLSRSQQDEYAIASYEKAQKATQNNKFRREIIEMNLVQKNSMAVLDHDEDIHKIIFDKVARLNPAFEKDGTITAANASNLNDGAAALLLASKETVEKYALKPMAKIKGYADAAQVPEWFTTSPSLAIPKALHHAGLSLNDISWFELNEAYAAVALANRQILNITANKLNVYGGAVALGHPLGASGARILCTLISVLHQEGGRYGVAAICNGGGGASAMVIENLV